MFQPVEHALNARREVAVFLPPLEARPTAWWVDGEGAWIVVPGMLDLAIALSPDALGAAVEHGSMLLVEVGEDADLCTWIPVSA